MPEVSREEMGRRLFQINKERAVETAVTKIRQSLAHDWNTFTPSDIAILHYVLGEIWVGIDRVVWGKYIFSGLTLPDVRAIITLGVQLQQKNKLDKQVIDEFDRIIRRSK